MVPGARRWNILEFIREKGPGKLVSQSSKLRMPRVLSATTLRLLSFSSPLLEVVQGHPDSGLSDAAGVKT